MACDQFGCNICKSFQPKCIGESREEILTPVSQCSVRVRIEF